jgi:hypothetical protein
MAGLSNAGPTRQPFKFGHIKNQIVLWSCMSGLSPLPPLKQTISFRPAIADIVEKLEV